MSSPVSNGIGQVIERAARDAEYRALLLGDPAAALRVCGVPLPEGIALKVVENTADTVYLSLPPPPKPGESWDAALARMACETPFGDTVQLALSLIILHLVRFARAWSDPAFRERLAQAPENAMAELDAQVASSIRLEVVENTVAGVHVVLPPVSQRHT